MGMIDDILKALDRIPTWKRLQEVPAEVDDLKRRVVELEAKLGGKWPPDVCKYCGARAVRLTADSTYGGMFEVWTCGECGKQRQFTKGTGPSPPSRR